MRHPWMPSKAGSSEPALVLRVKGGRNDRKPVVSGKNL